MSIGRQFWVVAHRWAGLTIAAFLVVAGLTGTLLAFFDDLETLLAPQLHVVAPPTSGAERLDPVVLRERVQASYPGAVINYLPLQLEPGRSLKLTLDRIDPVTGNLASWSSDADEVFVDPYTGRILGQRKWGDLSQGAVNLMPFLYRLHYTLASGTIGRYALGIAALIWTLDSFIGFYLTLPPRRRRDDNQAASSARPWLSRWKPSWLVRWSCGQHKLTFDLHRAGGLWLWPLLFVFAWSSVAFNLDEVYDPVMNLFGQERIQHGIAPLATPRHAPKLDFKAAAALGRDFARREAAQRGLVLESEGASALSYRPNLGIYVYYFSTDRDFTARGGRCMAVFDGDRGELLKLVLPQGQNGANTFTNWIMALHMANVWGLPYRIAVSVIGLMVTSISVTGVLIWIKKREARSLAAMKLGRRRADHDCRAIHSPVQPASSPHSD